MSQLPPCPQCQSERVWARAALGAFGITHVAFCPGCARAATICGRCGGELVLTRESSWAGAGHPRVAARLQCPGCRQSPTAPQPQPTSARPTFGSPPTAGTLAPRPTRALLGASRGFAPDDVAPATIQRVADDFEHLATTRYKRRCQLFSLVGEAARRADAMARLEADLARLD